MADRLLEIFFNYSAQGLLLIGVSATRPPQYQVISANSIGQQLLGNHLSVASLLQDGALLTFFDPLTEIPQAIHKVLGLLGEMTEADRAYLFERDPGTQGSFSNTYEWCAPGIEPQQEQLQGIVTQDYPRFFEEIQSQDHVIWPCIQNLPKDSPDRQGLDVQQIQSLLVVALNRGEELIGFLGLDFVRQAHSHLETLLPLLQVMGQVFTNVLERQEIERSLRLAESQYRSIFENATEGILQSSPNGHYLKVNPALARIYAYDSPADLQAHITDIAGQLYVNPRRREEFIQALTATGTVTDFESQVYRIGVRAASLVEFST